jgi:hypothetical protein
MLRAFVCVLEDQHALRNQRVIHGVAVTGELQFYISHARW